jgi:hypothetical protein
VEQRLQSPDLGRVEPGPDGREPVAGLWRGLVAGVGPQVVDDGVVGEDLDAAPAVDVGAGVGVDAGAEPVLGGAKPEDTLQRLGSGG